MELTSIRPLEYKNCSLNFSVLASKITAKVFAIANLNEPYDRAKCAHLPSTPPWSRNHPQSIDSATPASPTLAESSDVTKIYTDGSVGLKGAGYAVVIYDETDHTIKESLPSYISIFQAEGFAIMAALKWNLKSNYPSSQKFEIYSDSKAALLASTPSAAAKSTEAFSLIVSILSAHHNVKLFWIPSHTGHPGNATADKVAKEAAQS